MADRSSSIDPHQDLNQDCLCLVRVKAIPHCQLSYGLPVGLKIFSRIQDMYCQTLHNGRTSNAFFLRAREHTEFELTESLMMETSQDIVSCCPLNHVWQALVWWRNSCLVGSLRWMSDYEGYWSKEATKDLIHWYPLQRHTKGHEKESIHPSALSANISSLEDETKSW